MKESDDREDTGSGLKYFICYRLWPNNGDASFGQACV